MAKKIIFLLNAADVSNNNLNVCTYHQHFRAERYGTENNCNSKSEEPFLPQYVTHTNVLQEILPTRRNLRQIYVCGPKQPRLPSLLDPTFHSKRGNTHS